LAFSFFFRCIDQLGSLFFEIVILSLVRNSGAPDEVEITGFASGERANIGFLKVGIGHLHPFPLLKCRFDLSLRTGLMVTLIRIVSLKYLSMLVTLTVALSRAREGLFILGNAPNLASRSHMWRSVIDELEQNDAVGAAFPVVCQRHPDIIEYVSEPGRLPRLAPDGMYISTLYQWALVNC
jgi:hypothetical protein